MINILSHQSDSEACKLINLTAFYHTIRKLDTQNPWAVRQAEQAEKHESGVFPGFLFSSKRPDVSGANVQQDSEYCARSIDQDILQQRTSAWHERLMELITDGIGHADQQREASPFPVGHGGCCGDLILHRMRNQESQDQISDEMRGFADQSARIRDARVLHKINEQEQANREHQENGCRSNDPSFFDTEKFRFLLLCLQQMDQQQEPCHEHNRPLCTRKIIDKHCQLIKHVRKETRDAPAQTDGLIRWLGRQNEDDDHPSPHQQPLIITPFPLHRQLPLSFPFECSFKYSRKLAAGVVW